MTNICIGLLAHVDAGKTTLSESLLYLSGSIRKAGRVDNRDAFLDTYELEKARGITIFSKQAVFNLGEQSFTLVDTPGHVDFSSEMERTLQVLDYAVLVVSGSEGVQSHTRTLWKLLERYKKPVFIFVNKMDQPQTDRSRLMAQMQDELSSDIIDFTADRLEYLEQLAMCDEAVMEQFLETGEVKTGDTIRLIRERKAFPCWFGSALKMQGIDAFLEGLGTYMQAPAYGDDFGARVFKISRDAQGSRLTHLKLTGGSLKVKDLLGDEKVNQIRIYHGEKYETPDSIRPGSVCAVTGPEHTQAGQGFGIEEKENIPVLEPVLTYKLQLPDGAVPAQVMGKLAALEEEEPSLHIIWEEEIREIHIQLMGEIQIEVLRQMISERFGLDVTFGEGRIVYKETIAAPAYGVGHFEPLRHYAEVHLKLEPWERGSGLIFESTVSENDLSRNWQRLILTHLKEKRHRGVLTGAPITDMKITLVAGRAHPKHTEGGDFRQATYRAVRQGLMMAQNVILEPWYRFRLEVPSQMVGRAMMDIEQRAGRCSLEENSGEMAVLTGTAPVKTLREYQKDIAAYTSGRGRISCEPDGYHPCHDPEAVYEEIGYDAESDLANTPDSVFCAHGAGYIVPWYEVQDYMHLPGPGMKQEEAAELTLHAPRRDSQTGQRKEISYTGEDELMAIFTRTYGAPKSRLHDTSVTIKAPAEYVWKPAKKAPPKDSYLLVDGYNIIFSWKELEDLAKADMAAARDKLMEILSDYQGYTKDHLILVFDAYKVEGFQGEVIHWHNIDVVFTKEAETADQYIEKTAHVIGRKYRVTVATSDGTEQVIIRGQGCLLMSSSELETEVKRVRSQLRGDYLQRESRTGNYLGNYMPEDVKSIKDPDDQ